jgi:hypothetical protein
VKLAFTLGCAVSIAGALAAIEKSCQRPGPGMPRGKKLHSENRFSGPIAVTATSGSSYFCFLWIKRFLENGISGIVRAFGDSFDYRDRINFISEDSWTFCLQSGVKSASSKNRSINSTQTNRNKGSSRSSGTVCQQESDEEH